MEIEDDDYSESSTRTVRSKGFDWRRIELEEEEEKVVVVGYYKDAPCWKEFEKRLAIPVHGPTVFCGYLRSLPEQKIEIYLHWNEWDVPVVLMYEVDEYGDDVRFMLREEPEEEEDLEFFGYERQEYECPFFRVSGEDFYERRGQPFVLSEYRFVDTYSIPVPLDEKEEAGIDIHSDGFVEEGVLAA